MAAGFESFLLQHTDAHGPRHLYFQDQLLRFYLRHKARYHCLFHHHRSFSPTPTGPQFPGLPFSVRCAAALRFLILGAFRS